MATKVQTSPPRDYAQETRGNLQAQIDLNPKLLESEQATRPRWTALELETINQMLTGVGGHRGLLSMYEEVAPRLSALEAAASTRQRESDVSDVKRLGPEVMAALRESNPAAWSILDRLNAEALGDLEAGASMTPSMRRELEQTVRAGQSARGMGVGPVDLYEEALTVGEAGENLKARRRGFAQSMLGVNQSMLGDPMLAITGRSAGIVPGTFSATGQGQGYAASMGPRIFNPESQYGADIAQGNYEGLLAARTASATNRAGLFGGLLGAVGRIAGGFIGGLGGG